MQQSQTSSVPDIFSLIDQLELDETKIEEFKSAIINDPSILSSQNKDFLTPVVYAIMDQKIRALDIIIKHDDKILGKKDEDYEEIVFLAINNKKVEVVKYLTKNYSETISQQKDLYEKDLLMSCLASYLSSEDEEQKQDSRQILNIIYKNTFKIDEDLTDDKFQLLVDFYKNYAHLMLGYSKKNFEQLNFNATEIYKTLVNELLEKSQHLDDIDENYKKLLELCNEVLNKINKDMPIETDESKYYIRRAELIDAESYFLFQVNKQNNRIISVAYCDGVRLLRDYCIKDEFKEEYSSKVTTTYNFVIPYNYENINRFISQNSKYVKRDDFIRANYHYDSDSEYDSDYEGDNPFPDQSIASKELSRNNSSYKSLKILFKKILNLKYPNIDFKNFEVEMHNDVEDITSAVEDDKPDEKPSVSGNILFKKFKSELTINAIENLKKIIQKFQIETKKRKFSETEFEGISKEFQEIEEDKFSKDRKNDVLENYLVEKINEVFEIVRQNSLVKIENNSQKSKELEVEIHRRIASKLSEASVPSPRVEGSVSSPRVEGSVSSSRAESSLAKVAR